MEFTRRVEMLRPKLRAIARRLDGRYTAFNDEDLCQEAMLAWWIQHGQGKMADKTDSFVLQGGYFAMKNFIRTHHRRIDRQSTSLDAPIGDDGMTVADTLPQPQSVRADELAEQTLAAESLRARLNERENIVFSLYCRGLTTREIGRQLCVSHAMVVKIQKRIKEICRQVGEGLQGDGYQGAGSDYL